MSLRERVSAFWMAWQWIVLLAVALLASLALNVHQWRRLIAAPLQARIDGLEQARATAAQLIADGQTRERELLAAQDAVTLLLNDAAADYAAAAAAAPLAGHCAPGAGRVSAVNRALGVQKK